MEIHPVFFWFCCAGCFAIGFIFHGIISSNRPDDE